MLPRVALLESHLLSAPLIWDSTTPLVRPLKNQPLGKQMAVIHDGIIFVIGGIDNVGVYSSGVFSSAIQPGGKLGPWIGDPNGFRTNNGPAIPIGFAAVAKNKGGWAYVTGGFSRGNFLPSTFFAKLDISGVTNSWEPTDFNFPKRAFHTSVILDDELYVLGGWDGNTILDTVYYTHISPNGGLVHNWIPTTALEPGRFAHATVAYDRLIYVIGGRINSLQGGRVATDSVQFAFADNGIVSNWKQTTPLPEPLSDLSAVVSEEGIIYVIGGRNSNIISNKVYSATILDDGNLTNWEDISVTQGLTLPIEPGLHSHAAVYSKTGSIYVLGGRINNLGSQPAHYVSNVYYIPPLTLTKSNNPSGPVHEGDVIDYTISYANTSLITQTMTITDVLPFNLTYTVDSAVPSAMQQGSTLVWDLGKVSSGESGQVFFKAQVPLLPSLQQAAIGSASVAASSPAFILPVPITCDTTQFWANGVTHQPPIPNPYTIQVQVPPNSNPSKMWLMMKYTDNTAPQVEGQSAQLEVTTNNTPWGASLWSAPITSGMVADNEVTVITNNPRNLNALFLFDADDPPFEPSTLYDTYNTMRTFSYTLEIPSVATQTMDVILPFMDITYWWDNLEPDTRATTVTVEFDGKDESIVANDPNLGNGLLMTQFPFTIGPFTDTITSAKVLTVTVDTEDSIYTLGPRICRPVYIENTAWLCSQQAGCIASTVTNIPENFDPPGGIYLPIILESFSQ